MKIPVHDCGRDGNKIWVMLKEYDDKSKRWAPPKMKIRLQLSPDRVLVHYPNYVNRVGDTVEIQAAPFLYKLRTEGIDDYAVHMDGKYRTAKERTLGKRKARDMGNTKHKADLELTDKSQKPSELESKIVLGLKELKIGTKNIIKRVRLKIEKDADKGDCTLVFDDSIDKISDVLELDTMRKEIYAALEKVDGVKRVISLEPVSPKDEG